MPFQVSDSITPNHGLNKTIAGVRLQSPKGPGLLGQNPALAGGMSPALNTGLGAAPMAPQPQLATASGVQQLAGQQGLASASPPPAPLAKLGGEIMQVPRPGKGRRAQSEKRKPARADDLLGMLRGKSGRPVKRANLITGGQMPAWAQESQPMPQAQASGNFFTRQDLLAYGQQPQLQQPGGLQQLLGLEDQLAQQEGQAQNPAQNTLQELQLQKTVLGGVSDRELEDFMRRTNLLSPEEIILGGEIKRGREVPIKDGYTFGRTALESQLAQRAATDPAQDVLQEMALQKTVLGSMVDRELEAFMRRTNLLAPDERISRGQVQRAREVPIKAAQSCSRCWSSRPAVGDPAEESSGAGAAEYGASRGLTHYRVYCAMLAWFAASSNPESPIRGVIPKKNITAGWEQRHDQVLLAPAGQARQAGLCARLAPLS